MSSTQIMRKHRVAGRWTYGRYDLLIAALCEAGLLLLAGGAAMITHKPLFSRAWDRPPTNSRKTPSARARSPTA